MDTMLSLLFNRSTKHIYTSANNTIQLCCNTYWKFTVNCKELGELYFTMQIESDEIIDSFCIQTSYVS